MKISKRFVRIVAGVSFVVLLAGIGVWQRLTDSSRVTSRITTVSGLKQVGLAFRLERNDVARFSFQGEPLKVDDRTGK